MQNETLRKRGWSIHSETSQTERSADSSINNDEKQALLNAFPDLHTIEMESSADDLEVQDHPSVKKRQKGEDGKAIPVDDKRMKLLEVAKGRLSKWAARLFDPNRPRGLIQPPRVIPLNDDFLKAFGKREKEFDEQVGRKVEVVNPNLDDDDDPSKALAYQEQEHAKELDIDTVIPVEGRKLKLQNLNFRTTEKTLEEACRRFGPLSKCMLIMSDTPQNSTTPLNSGLAYVTFESRRDAEKCMKEMTTLEGRPLRISLAQTKKGRKSTRGVDNSGVSRYWERDISTRCFRCGQVGHLERDCRNPAIPKPCPLCAATDHDLRSCPISRVCFKCGVPGHINRDCPYDRQLPTRMVCGICFESGHNRMYCRRRPIDACDIDKAICMVCGQQGHFMCGEMKFFFGLDGITCFNCGGTGHLGYDCDRPPVDVCARDFQTTLKELERAEAVSLQDELETQRQQGRRGRSREQEKKNGFRRHKSQPPIRTFGRHDSQSEYRSGPPPLPPPPQAASMNGRGYSGDGNRGYSGQPHQRGNSTNNGRGYRSGSRGYR